MRSTTSKRCAHADELPHWARCSAGCATATPPLRGTVPTGTPSCYACWIAYCALRIRTWSENSTSQECRREGDGYKGKVGSIWVKGGRGVESAVGWCCEMGTETLFVTTVVNHPVRRHPPWEPIPREDDLSPPFYPSSLNGTLFSKCLLLVVLFFVVLFLIVLLVMLAFVVDCLC